MVAADMLSYLEDSGLNATFYNAFVPASPTHRRILVITPYGGLESLFTHDSADVRIDIPRFQLKTADRDGAVAESLAVEATNRLAQIRNETIGGARYLSVRPLQPPFFLRRDPDTERVEYAVNFEAEKTIDEVGS